MALVIQGPMMLDPSGLTVRHLGCRAWAKALPGALRRIMLTGWDSLLSFRLAWRTLCSKLNASNLQGLKIRGRCFLISISDGAIRSVLVTV